MNSPPTVPLFPEPERTALELSKMWSGAPFRIPSGAPNYTPLKVKAPLDCIECFARQHETKGECGPRHPAKTRRQFPKVPGSRLDLCRGHEQLWRQRDADDLRRTDA